MPTCASCGQENPEGFRFCGRCGAELGHAEPPREVRKTVTIVFSDVTGSTALGERLDREATRRLMRRYYDAMSAAVERHGGKVEKFIGDAVMAVFGIPTLHEDDALRAVRAAADMRRDLAALNDELERDFGVRIEARTGVNPGEVVAGGWPRTRRLSSTSVSPARAATPRRRSRTRRGSSSNASRANGRWSSSWTTCIGRSRPSSTWWSTSATGRARRR